MTLSVKGLRAIKQEEEYLSSTPELPGVVALLKNLGGVVHDTTKD